MAQSKPVVRSLLKRAGVGEYKRYVEFFMEKLSCAFGPSWTATHGGVYVNGALVLPEARVRAFLIDEPITPAVAVARMAAAAVSAPPPAAVVDSRPAVVEEDPVAPTVVEPTFRCKKKGCEYAGYTKKALEAHCRRTGH